MKNAFLFVAIIVATLCLVACRNVQQPVAQVNDATEFVPDDVALADPVSSNDATDSNGETDASFEGDDVSLAGEPVDFCVGCHADAQALMDTAKPENKLESENISEWKGISEEVAPMEPWEKVFVNYDAFTETVHGKITCSNCHNGEQSADKDIAHTGLITNPSENPDRFCGECHPDVVTHSANSLHSNLQGFWTAIDIRSGTQNHPALQEMFNNQCDSCHATCGDCHVSQPASVGGGFIDGHLFNRTPSMIRNCTACHGSRVGNEYMGKHEDLKADVHFLQGQMQCVDCHDGQDMHGYEQDCQACHPGPEDALMTPPDHRYDGVQSPRCESCHVAVTLGDDGIQMHELHGAELSCQVCHSISYSNCDGCHVAVSKETGNPFFKAEGSYLGFFIGKNINKSFDRPYEYVTVRHIPVETTSYEYYGENLLPKFNELPTWVYATPHNIQRNTPQTESCTSCHENPDLFLTADKVSPEEIEANLGVIVIAPPPSVIDLFALPTIPEPDLPITSTEVTP
jgi:hypothetical protein